MNQEHAFDVRRRGKVEFEVTLSNSGPSAPIVIGFPHWYREPETEQYPPDLGHMALAVKRPSIYDDSVHTFTVVVGSHAEYKYTTPFDENSSPSGQMYSRQLGMNFIAFDSSFENEHMKVGFVGKYDNVDDNTVYSGPGWYASQEATDINRAALYMQPKLKIFNFNNGISHVVGAKVECASTLKQNMMTFLQSS